MNEEERRGSAEIWHHEEEGGLEIPDT